jgi:hypothetical protein|tara:strand:+ start:753 stop:1079 length:327 start_codon:yes stop_codon:yes gene_type:complete
MGALRDDLVAAKALIDTPEKWGKGNGSFLFACVPSHQNCALTACCRVSIDAGREDDYAPMYSALMASLPDGVETVWAFNDDRKTTHADVMALFDRAIAAASPSQTQPE